jgi:hypothetical protein
MNYRSAVVFGRAAPIGAREAAGDAGAGDAGAAGAGDAGAAGAGDAAKLAALRVLSERLMPGRWAEVRPPTKRELAGTLVLALPLTEASVKISAGPPSDSADPPPDPAVWAGVLPLRLAAGEPEPAPDVPPGVPVPRSVGCCLP